MAAIPRTPRAILSLVSTLPTPLRGTPARYLSYAAICPPSSFHAAKHALLPTRTTFVRTATTTTTFSSTSHENIAELLAPHDKPESPSYFTGNFRYNDLLIKLDTLRQQYIDALREQQREIPNTAPRGGEPPHTWKLKTKMSEILGIPLTTSQWRKITSHLNALASLPPPHSPEIEAELNRFMRFDSLQQAVVKVRELDDMGRAYGLGRRKESSARCWLVEGEGRVLVNGKEVSEYFSRLDDREEILWPFQVTETLGKFNAWCLADGGGTTGGFRMGSRRVLFVQGMTGDRYLVPRNHIVHIHSVT
ncbi:hypothetical protein BC936DRAFT_137425 [Jimgerdemannia flammicorona]|uniref:Uncharacterized protein n=1 Tax=Jimgerdemannia flammicorona TaxID=994334 RepID=A0A433DJE7_9FUNG|nr:hypothetical protein BC936DRAFT_137425 [Jimgerdemannia flammicorona]